MLACDLHFPIAAHMSNYKRDSTEYSGYGTRMIRWLIVLFFVTLGVACAPAPVQEMSEARQAIEAARAAGAEQRAVDQFEKAQSLLKTAQDMLNDRRFRDARRSAAQARDEAILARETAQQVSEE